MTPETGRSHRNSPLTTRRFFAPTDLKLRFVGETNFVRTNANIEMKKEFAYLRGCLTAEGPKALDSPGFLTGPDWD